MVSCCVSLNLSILKRCGTHFREEVNPSLLISAMLDSRVRIDQSQPSLLDSCRLGCDWSKNILARPVIQLWCGARNADWQNGWKSSLIEWGSSNCIVLTKISWKTFYLINDCSFHEQSLLAGIDWNYHIHIPEQEDVFDEVALTRKCN